jgi:hypothetical protein
LNLQSLKRINNLPLLCLKFKRATLTGVAFFLLLPSQAHSRKPNVFFTDIRKKTEQLMTAGQQKDAIEYLKSKRLENLNNFNKTKIEKLLISIANTFMNQETHKKFYQAQTLKTNDPEAAIELLKTVRALEPLNEVVALELSWIEINNKRCKDALEILNSVTENNPVSKRGWWLKLSALSCLKDWESFALTEKQLLQNIKTNKSETKTIRVLRLEESSLSLNDQLLIDELYLQDPKFPLILYWKGVVSLSTGKTTEDLAANYLSICQSQKAKVVNSYENFPLQCDKVQVVNEWPK